MKLTAKISGTNALLKKFDKFGKAGEKEVESLTRLAANEIEAEAKRLAPVDLGGLRLSITREEVSKLVQTVVAYAPYSAFMEFGTGGLVSIPRGWEAMAAQFRGKGIKKINLTPKPFLYPAFKKGGKMYRKDLKKSLEILIDKFNKQ
jgi:HK97 gp10 family phage protein